MSAESHLEKIKKLLRLSKSANPHEAELALQRAMELAAKHAVDLDALENDPEVGEIAGRWFPMPARLAREWKMALGIAKKYFHVEPCIIRQRKKVLLVGRSDAVDVADYIIGYLVAEVRRQVGLFSQAEKSARRRMTSGKRAAFVSGFFFAIGSRLKEGMMDLMRENDRMAIIIRNEEERRSEVLKGMVGETSSLAGPKAPRMSSATLKGWGAGQKANLHRGLAGSAEATSKLSQGALLLS